MAGFEKSTPILTRAQWQDVALNVCSVMALSAGSNFIITLVDQETGRISPYSDISDVEKFAEALAVSTIPFITSHNIPFEDFLDILCGHMEDLQKAYEALSDEQKEELQNE